jgi:hypothetical protein
MRDKVKKRTAVQAMITAKRLSLSINENRDGAYSDNDFEWDEVIDNLIRVIEEMIKSPLTDRQISRISSECRQIRES